MASALPLMKGWIATLLTIAKRRVGGTQRIRSAQIEPHQTGFGLVSNALTHALGDNRPAQLVRGRNHLVDIATQNGRNHAHAECAEQR